MPAVETKDLSFEFLFLFFLHICVLKGEGRDDLRVGKNKCIF